MNFIDPARHTRRAFLRRSTQLAAAGTALPFALNLAALGEAAAFEANDYKALVCVFLYGGCDYANTVVPYDSTRYGQYSAIRGGNSDGTARSEEHTSELQSQSNLVCRLLLEKKKRWPRRRHTNYSNVLSSTMRTV